MENDIRGPQEMQLEMGIQVKISLYPPDENRKIERRVRKNISGEVGNVERTKDGTNKMRDMSKGQYWCYGNFISPRGAQLSLLLVRRIR